MKGKILAANSKGGVICAEDGERYKFALRELQNGKDSTNWVGVDVDFDVTPSSAGGMKAVAIYRAEPIQPPPPLDSTALHPPLDDLRDSSESEIKDIKKSYIIAILLFFVLILGWVISVFLTSL